MRLIREADLNGKKVLVRADLDVPIEKGIVGEDYRLKALLPTLKYLLENGASVLIIGHLGRPEGKPDPALSLEPVAKRLSELLGQKIKFSPDYSLITNHNREIARFGVTKPSYSLAMLENLRFWPGEEANDLDFAKKLSALGDIYVNEAFASHRAHASIVLVPKLLPSYAGLRLEQEILHLSGVIENPARPLVFILGGAKTEIKKPLIADFAKIADRVLLGGLLMFDKELEKIPNVVFPVDSADGSDIGPETIKLFASITKEAKTVVWNGPLGIWEDNRFELGTRAIAEELALLPGKTIVGGGDTIAAISAFGLLDKMSYVSLGGGAMLEFLAGKKLPALAALGYY
ncbi:hypothetical protein A2797_02305 [candidate division WWE3 bacterium RIFCSPHIGHO2_01_FULL_48_15]|uniref:Phosphoglycerate kinase n=1 Tax=candidate division WWE3 bacterium RIFCSPHIGHO2_01_FULL_48_15 TaxID=1802619 RepID=A0A1F4VDD7_UNCKA|nr:MAG: hypothetical protein A2797_02305 [candidate division WWE3 bacterium RIFCSPHIGHO2_01_FULL_48_15]